MAGDAAAIAKGAATGGTAGALKAALKTGSGRKGLMFAAALPLIAGIAVVSMVAGSASSSVTSLKGSHDALSASVVTADFKDEAMVQTLQGIGAETSTDWQVLAAIIKIQKGRFVDKGVGPFGLDMSKVGEEISEKDAADLNASARYVGRKILVAGQGTLSTLDNRALDAGAVDYTSNAGTSARKIPADQNAKDQQSAVKKQYVAALSTLPVKGNPAIANSVYALAQNWAMGANASDSKCAAGSVTLGGSSTVKLNDSQKNYAQYIINTAANRSMPKKAAVIALSTALQESTLRMYWNPKVDGSQELAPDTSAEGTDGYSVGLFQQQVHGSEYSWGTVSDAMNPDKSATMFLNALDRVSGWDAMDVSVAAQTVQVSAFPSAYAKWEDMATQLVTDLKPTGSGSFSDGDSTPAPSASPSPSGDATATPSPTAPAKPVISADGCTFGVGSGSAGKGDDYPFKEPAGACAWCSDVDADGNVDPWTLYKRECVSFVAWRMNVQMGWKEGQPYPFTPSKLGLGGFGSAVEWKGNLAKAGFVTDSTPKVGAIAWWDAFVTAPSTITGEAGHVAVVSAVNADGTISLEEYNFNPWRYGTRTIPAADVTGFIHVADISDTSPSSTASPSPSPSAK
ncbi:MAG TPA: CHAP domain-containing protein [Arthrobacter sp.]